ncbi:MAG TPA: hypothetical protein VN664_02220 [Burkholderiales bacterium]|jgi:signal transduction histidine kinase|nr:hypothetical protein [Burkholderiales bacterium]
MERSSAEGSAPVAAALDALATSMGLGLLLLDSTGRPAFSNRAAFDLLGCSDLDGVAARWQALLAVMVTQGDAVPEAASRAFTADLPLQGTTRFLRGEIRSAAGGREVFLKDRRSLGTIDIELLRASRMREWSHQCDTVVHEANGALNSIQFALELLVGQWPGQEASGQVRESQGRNHVTVIRENLDKLKNTLRHLLGADDTAPASGVFDLRDVVQEAIYTLRMPSRRHRIDLQSRVSATALPLKGNRARIRQVLVGIALSRFDSLAQRSHLTLEANAEGQKLEIVCRDDGPLAEGARAAIFKLMGTESDAGTAADAFRLARAVVESEAGEFQIDNDGGSGTVFHFVFSRSAP